MAIPDYKLSAVLYGHSLDVRCVTISTEDCILSASRDRTAKLWHPEGTKDFSNVVTYKGHTNFVSCICWVPPCITYTEGLVVTGSNDNSILGFNLQDGTVLLSLKAHENAVSCVKPGLQPGTLLSSSWDNTAKMWNLDKSTNSPIVFKGHQAAVWCVIELSNGTVATASGDKTIIIWNKDGTKVKTLTGHTDCVRGLVVASQETFLSCANDASIKLWTNLGECINTYYGHSNYIYSIALNPAHGDACFVSCGEDGTARVWQGGDCVRTIQLPAMSVWSVACLHNGDIVTGSSDGVVRVFSHDPRRYADDNAIALYEQEVEKTQQAAQQEIGGYKLTDLPGPEALLEPGKADGQTKLVRRGTTVKCYSWSAASCSWTELGEVMGSNPSDGKTMYQGKEYDFVFSVDIEDGKPPIKLPYNRGEDPWVAAQAFIHQHQLPQTYLDQVANFIVSNAKNNSLPVSSNGMADPLTGESRYVPGSGAGAPVAPALDPFTGAGAYVTGAAPPAAPPAAHGKPLIPHDTYLRFDQGNLSQILDKVREFNQRVGDGIQPLTDDQLQAVVKLAETNSASNPNDIELLKKMLKWPKEILFPVLDTTRLAVRNEQVNSILFNESYGPDFVKFLVSLLSPDSSVANAMLAMRVFVNAFCHLPGEMMTLAAHESIVHALICLPEPNKSTQVAAATLLLNFTVALAQQADNTDLAECIIQLLGKTSDNEAYFRGLVALGNLLVESPEKIKIKSKIVLNIQFHNRLKGDALKAASVGDPNSKKVCLCSQQILQLL